MKAAIHQLISASSTQNAEKKAKQLGGNIYRKPGEHSHHKKGCNRKHLYVIEISTLKTIYE